MERCRFFYKDVKTAVGSGSLNQIASQNAMDGEDILRHFLAAQKVAIDVENQPGREALF